MLVFMKGEKSDREDDSDKYGWVDKAILKFKGKWYLLVGDE